MAMLPADMKYSPEMDANKYAGSKESLTANPSNGSVYYMNQPIEITVPMRQPEYVCDFKNAYVSFQIKNNDGTADNTAVFQSLVGSLGMVNQQVIKTSTGVEFSNFDAYNVLSPLLFEREADANWYAGKGNILFGMSNDTTNANGLSIAGGGGIAHKVLPLINTGIAQQYFPMGSLADIVLRFKLDTASSCFVTADTKALPADASIEISNIVLHYDIYRMSDLALSSINSRLVNNSYVIDTTDWVHQQYSDTGLTKFNVQIGFAKRKAKRLIMILRDTANITGDYNKGLMSRNQAGITKVYAKLDGKTYQSSSGVEMAQASNMVDAYAELLKHEGGLLDMSSNTNTLARFNLITSGTAPTDWATSGSFYHEIDFSNSMDTESSVSGVAIDHNNLQVFVEKTGTTAQTVDFFIEFYNQYTMNRSEGVWSVSDPVQFSQVQ
jgi:hypothetical protein